MFFSPDPKISTFEKATIVAICIVCVFACLHACVRVCVCVCVSFSKTQDCGSVVDNTLNYQFIGWLVVLGLTAL